MNISLIVRSTCFAAVTALLAACSPSPDTNTNTDNEHTVLLSKEHLHRIENVLQEEVDAGVRGGFVALVATGDEVVYQTAVGMADPYQGIPMAADTRFRIASMTKPVVTAAVMQLVDRGEVRLNDPVAKFIPAFSKVKVATSYDHNEDGQFDLRSPKRRITVHDLLTHMSGLGYVFDTETDLGQAYINANLYGKEGTLAERIDVLTTLPLYNDPKEEWRYSFATDVAGHLVELISGQTLEEYLIENIFAPLGMNDTEFFLDDTDFTRLAVVNEFNEAGEMFRSGEASLTGEGVNDAAFGVMAGGAGLVSTAEDYIRFAQMMLNGGSLDGANILSPATVRLMMTDNTPYEALPENWQRRGVTFGIGGAIIQKPGRYGAIAAQGEWGWSGYWDTSFAINPEDGVIVILMAQTQPGPHMPRSAARDRVKAIAYGALQ